MHSKGLQVRIILYRLNHKIKTTEAGGSKLRPRFASPVTTTAVSNYQSGLSHFIWCIERLFHAVLATQEMMILEKTWLAACVLLLAGGVLINSKGIVL